MPDPALRAETLGRDHPTPHGPLTVLDGVSFTVERGATLAVVGPSGSGKSTLLGLLAGLDRPSRGTVRLLGEDLAALAPAALARVRRERLGFVFQSHRLVPSFTALENAALPLELAGARDARDRAAAMLDEVGLGRRLDHRPQQLSGGEQQRVAVARALAHAPPVVLADEPTGSLDRDTGVHIADLLFGLCSRHDAALVVVTHDPALAARCARFIRLDGGRVAA